MITVCVRQGGVVNHDLILAMIPVQVSCIVSAEEEQSPAMFEAACNERIQQFDDSESDEEVGQ